MTTLQGALIELFELDVTPVGGSNLMWHNGSNEFGSAVIWQGQTYLRMPVEATGFDISGQGKLPRPTLRVANVDQVIGGLVRQYDDLVGLKVTRRRTFAKYLDAANFVDGNPNADPSAEFPADIFYVDRKTSENKFQIEWELASALDLQGVQLPKRQILANVCPWRYKGAECGYVSGGGGVDWPAFDGTKCDHGLGTGNGCKAHFDGSTGYPFGGFPGAGLGRR